MGVVEAMTGALYTPTYTPTMDSDTLPLSEVFGPTWQGEGPHTGRVCAFVRLGMCNLSCEWCDTPYTWDTTRYDVKAECPETAVGAIHARLAAIGAPVVVLSGGEPLVHHNRLVPLLNLNPDDERMSWEWHVETNGTIPPPPWWDEYVAHTTVSPKLSTRDPVRKRLKPRALQAWADKAASGWAAFKFVVQNTLDLDMIGDLEHQYQIPKSAIWVMPEGTTPDVVMRHHRDLADAILARGYNTTTRLHTLLWGQERGH